MKLYDMGLLSLDELMIKYIPEADNNGKGNITIRNLLLHNSGYDADYPFNGNYNVDRTEIFNWTYTTPLKYATGTKYIYSDVNFIVLQIIVERITGMSLAVFA